MADQSASTGAPVDTDIQAMQDKAARFGAGYAVFSEALQGESVDRAVLVAKVVIAVIALYALVSAVTTGLS